MNKEELIRLIYSAVNEEMLKGSNFTLKSATNVYDAFISGIKQSLYEGEEVRIPQFGRFYVNHTSARTIPHPRVEGQTIEVEPRRQIRFKVYPTAKNQLNEKS